MPIYEYQCSNCEHKMEALQKISADPLTNCPSCDESSLIKLISAASFRLKGSGWYETDFKTGKKKQLAESESSKPKDAGSGKPKGSDQPSGKSTGAGSSTASSNSKQKTSTGKAAAKSS